MVISPQSFQTSGAPIAFIGDAHLNMFTPSSRTDDYPSTCCEKLLSLLDVCRIRRVKSVVFTGDFFHQTNQSIPFMFKVMAALGEFYKEGIKLYSIVGNHDIKNELLENLDRSPLGVTFLSGLMEPLGTLTVTESGRTLCQVKGVHFGQSITAKSCSSEIKSILVAHVFYNMGFPVDNLSEADAVSLGHDYFVLGHDHVPYEATLVNSPIKQVVIRPGSFMRASSHEYNVKDRKVWVDIYDPTSDVWIRDSLFIKPSEEVFNASVVDKVDTKEIDEDLSKKFTELVNSLYTHDLQKISVYQILDTLTIDLEVKGKIEEYLYANGILRS